MKYLDKIKNLFCKINKKELYLIEDSEARSRNTEFLTCHGYECYENFRKLKTIINKRYKKLSERVIIRKYPRNIVAIKEGGCRCKKV